MKNLISKKTKESVAQSLFDAHKKHEGAPNITLDEAGHFLDASLGLLFPQLSKNDASTTKLIEGHVNNLSLELFSLLERSSDAGEETCRNCVDSFINELPEIYAEVLEDAQSLKDGDPAAYSIHEIIISYPGFYAIAAHRIANRFYKIGVPLFPRLLSEYSHRVTGVDINPGAKIGKSFFLDHATAVVIGETAIIGDNVKIYQGVTLGALKVNKGQKNIKRHPTIEDNVVIYANATILGGDTIIGHDSVIGGNVWLTKSIKPKSRVMYRSSDYSESGLDWTI
jgi:serine O-acetyltransferase